MSTLKSTIEVTLPAINKKSITIKIVGETPLVVNNWSIKRKIKKSGIINPMEYCIESMYWLEGKPLEYTEETFANSIKNGAQFGFPSRGFKDAIASAGYRAGLLKDKIKIYGAFHIESEMVEIFGIPVIRENTLRMFGGVPAIHYLSMFPQWEAKLELLYNANATSAERLVDLVNCSGQTGIGAMCPEKGGDLGRYRIID